MDALKVYIKYIRMNARSGMQYKGWPIMVFQVFFVVITDPIGIILMFSRFGNIGVWSMERILLIYSMAVTSFGLAETFCRGFDYFPWYMLRTGDFDRVLLRPKPIITQVAGSYFHIHRIARVFSGICAIIWCLYRMKISLNFLDVIMIVLALTGGFLSYTGVFLFTSGIAFFTIKGLDWIYIFTNVSYQITRCPMDYMPKSLKYIFTFFMPMLVISYYPAAAICDWGDSYLLGFLALPASICFLIFSTALWQFGVRHYQSTGS